MVAVLTIVVAGEAILAVGAAVLIPAAAVAAVVH